ncbi:hypothetical protein ACHAWO_001017 [Cyclotella atomus]|uniref:PDZ domain-containing protein n=1 Tax=Cyclotella atomus TaxID=382360 RepID=A0ABD3PDP8_9STRA
MVFYTSDRFKGSVLQTWISVTSDRIRAATLKEIENKGESVSECTVELEIKSQQNLDQKSSTKLRKLQELTTPLLVNYTTVIVFFSLKEDWDANKFVSSGFTTNSQQRSYMFQLKAADTTNFDTINRFQMEVDGTIVTDTPLTPEPEGDGNSTLIWAIIGAAMGTLATAFLIGTAIYVRKRNRRKNSDKNSMEGADVFPDVEVSTKDTKPQASSYFGTIESREGDQDDVSTLGDPYFGEAVNAVMDRDDTVAESMISAEQDMYVYGVGRPRLDTGASSRMDTTISGKSGAKMMFNDDTTLEDIYKTPAMNIYDQEDGNSERITVVAPSGKLGIVIDNPGGDIPIVHAIKETSALHGRIKVGDFLLSVDERDCRGMSAVAVSKLISSRCENPSRTFVILRGSTTGGE